MHLFFEYVVCYSRLSAGESISGHRVLFPLDPEMFDVIILLWQKRRYEPTLFSVLVRDW